jgi:hypothetical protein
MAATTDRTGRGGGETMTADRIAASMRAEATRLRERADQLDQAAAMLESHAPANGSSADAPYGYKADGTPRKRRPKSKYGYKADGTPRLRPAPSARAMAKSIATRRRKGRPPMSELDVARRMRVISSTHLTPGELEGRELVHTTEAPAGVAV